MRRLVRRELAEARSRLEGTSWRARDVHEARKSIKKIRAVLRMLRTTLGRKFRKENSRLREAGRQLGALRDAEMMRRTFANLGTAAFGATVDRQVALGLERHERSTLNHARQFMGKARRLLDKSKGTLVGRVVRATTPGAIRHGLERSYRDSRDAFADLEINSGTPEFHAWRRRVKEHLYQVRLFESLDTKARARAGRLKQLERDLGAEHDLGHLSELLSNHPARFGGAKPTTIAQGRIQRRQRGLRDRALAQGERLFALRPNAFGSTARRWWRAKRRAED